MFRAEIFTLAKCWKHPNCSVIDWWLSTFWYQCNGIPQKEWHIWSDKYMAYVDTEKSTDEAYFNTEKLYKQKKYMLTKILYLFADQEYSYKKKIQLQQNKVWSCCFWSLLSSPSLLLSGDPPSPLLSLHPGPRFTLPTWLPTPGFYWNNTLAMIFTWIKPWV